MNAIQLAKTFRDMGAPFPATTPLALERAAAAVALLEADRSYKKLNPQCSAEEVDNAAQAWNNAMVGTPEAQKWPAGYDYRGNREAAQWEPTSDKHPRLPIQVDTRRFRRAVGAESSSDDSGSDDEHGNGEGGESESEDADDDELTAKEKRIVSQMKGDRAKLERYRWHLMIHFITLAARRLCSVDTDRHIASFIQQWCEPSEVEKTPGRFWSEMWDYIKSMLETKAEWYQTPQQVVEHYYRNCHKHDWSKPRGRKEAIMLLQELCVELEVAVTRGLDAQQDTHAARRRKEVPKPNGISAHAWRAVQESFAAAAEEEKEETREQAISMKVVQAMLDHEILTRDDLAVLAGTGLCVAEVEHDQDAGGKALYRLQHDPFNLILEPGRLPYKYTRIAKYGNETETQRKERVAAKAEKKSTGYLTKVTNATRQWESIHMRAQQRAQKRGTAGSASSSEGNTRSKATNQHDKRRNNRGDRNGRTDKTKNRSGGDKRSREPEPEQPRKQQDTAGRRSQTTPSQPRGSSGATGNQPPRTDGARRDIRPAWEKRRDEQAAAGRTAPK